MHRLDLPQCPTLRILGGEAPVNYKYELFLDEEGAKISKKIGNGVSMEQWRAYAPIGALLDFLLQDEKRLLAFCESIDLAPDKPARARALLPGGDIPHYT